MNSFIRFGLIGLCAFLSFESNAQRTDSISKKQVEVVDFKKDKTITITYKDGSTETMSENEANKKGLIHNGGYGNQTTVNSSTGEGKSIRIKSSATQPLYVLDGKEITEEEMKAINPSTIESINVLKDKSATSKYGVKGRNGVVEISLKKVEPAADEFNGKKIYEWIGAEKSDEIISFSITTVNDEEKIETVEHKGPNFTAADRMLLQYAKPDRILTIEKILIKRNGVERKLPSKLHRF